MSYSGSMLLLLMAVPIIVLVCILVGILLIIFTGKSSSSSGVLRTIALIFGLLVLLYGVFLFLQSSNFRIR